MLEIAVSWRKIVASLQLTRKDNSSEMNTSNMILLEGPSSKEKMALSSNHMNI